MYCTAFGPPTSLATPVAFYSYFDELQIPNCSPDFFSLICKGSIAFPNIASPPNPADSTPSYPP